MSAGEILNKVREAGSYKKTARTFGKFLEDNIMTSRATAYLLMAAASEYYLNQNYVELGPMKVKALLPLIKRLGGVGQNHVDFALSHTARETRAMFTNSPAVKVKMSIALDDLWLLSASQRECLVDALLTARDIIDVFLIQVDENKEEDEGEL